MKDQVENLKKRNIAAAAIYTGMSQKDILQTLDNCVFEAYKFLYVSPERLGTFIFLEKIKLTKVCMIAVDESHCISQWGYDFRPSYLKIAEIRKVFPDVPVLALTATATPEVVEDIQEKLLFREKHVLRKSFYRKNLAYVVRTTENKEEQLLHILRRVSGTSVVYVRNRKKTKEIADFLNKNGVSAEHFHAGLKNETRDVRQQRWMNDETRVIVATNAFGMGIDKPDVRTVVHMDLPDSLEAYFQEAGRAGRDGKKAFAVMLFNGGDVTKMRKRVSDTFPEKEMIRRVYRSLGDYYIIAEGYGLDAVFPFDLADFCMKFKLPVLITHNALKILQQAGYLELTDEQDNSSQVLFIVGKEDLYSTRLTTDQDKLIHVLLRSYTGLFTEPAYISEDIIASRLSWEKDKVYKELVGLAKDRIVRYIPRKQVPFITYVHEREAPERLNLGKETYDSRKERFVSRAKSILDYAKEQNVCRNQLLLSYFGEKNTKLCGQCDVCLKKQEQQVTDADFDKIRMAVLKALTDTALTPEELVQKLAPFKKQKVLQVIRFLLDNGVLKQTLPHNRLHPVRTN
ncbi:MAG TPA: RecQ family ATP-dependent DNA helicase, partial [Paludibacter sp.]|nr:RecQ family ATP-dependent DNA helicase [Paludibacter sp.]